MPASNRIELTAAERKELYLLILSSNRCNITEACAALGVSREWYYKWMRTDPAFARRVADTKEERIDFAECRLLQNIDGGSSPDIRFFLQTQGKSRGYGPETRITGDLSQPVGVGLAMTGNIGLHVSYPERPTSIEEWEQQVEAAKQARAERMIEAAKDPESAARDMLNRVRELEEDEDCERGVHTGGNGGNGSNGSAGNNSNSAQAQEQQA